MGGREGKKEVLVFGFRKEPGVKEKNALPKMEIDLRMNNPEVFPFSFSFSFLYFLIFVFF